MHLYRVGRQVVDPLTMRAARTERLLNLLTTPLGARHPVALRDLCELDALAACAGPPLRGERA